LGSLSLIAFGGFELEDLSWLASAVFALSSAGVGSKRQTVSIHEEFVSSPVLTLQFRQSHYSLTPTDVVHGWQRLLSSHPHCMVDCSVALKKQ